MSSAYKKIRVAEFLRSPLRSLPSLLHWVFILFAAPLVIFLAVRTPAFQSPDECNHFCRSWQVAHGGVVGGAGGYVDASIDVLYSYVATLPYDARAHIAAADVAAARRVPWSGRLIYKSFPNTAAYFPSAYIPQALAILIGQTFGIGVLNTLILARLLNGAMAIATCAFAISICRKGKLVMLTLLLFPMTLSLFASAGQDATIIALTCLACSLISRQLDAEAPMAPATIAIVIASISVVSIGRPTNFVLAAFFFIPGLLQSSSNKRWWRSGLVLAGITFATSVAWWAAVIWVTRKDPHPYVGSNFSNPKSQLFFLLHNPNIVPVLLGDIFRQTPFYLAGVVGLLGWVDTLMPSTYYLAMLLVLGSAILAEFSHGPAVTRSATVLIFGAAFLGIAGVFLSSYLLFTPVGSRTIDGAQGRYFIPLMVAAAAVLPQLGNSSKTYERVTAIVVVAQLLTAAVLPQVIMTRYYS